MLLDKIIEADLMAQKQQVQSTVEQEIEAWGNKWELSIELLLYLWKSAIVKSEEESGIIEELDYTRDTKTPRIDAFLLPKEIRGSIYSALVGEAEGGDVISVLEERGLVAKEEIDRALRCPLCGSFKIRTRLLCPHCGSYKVVPTKLIQHTVCGYTAPEAEFKTKEGLVCPSCGMPLKKEGQDYVVFGKIFYCEECKRMFKTPKIMFTCENSDTVAHPPGYSFSPQDATTSSIYRYYLTDKGREIIENGSLIIAGLKKKLVSLGEGLKVYEKILPETIQIAPEEIRSLNFDIIVVNEKTGNTLLIDFAGADAVTYVMKITLLKEKAPQYLLILTPVTSMQLLKLDIIADNIHVEDLTEHSFKSLVELAETLVL